MIRNENIERRIDELLERAHDNIDTEVLVENGLCQEDQEEYHALVKALLEGEKKGQDHNLAGEPVERADLND